MTRSRPLLLALAALALGCAGQLPPPAGPTPGAAGQGFTILQLNDVYKIEGLEGGNVGGLARVRTLRRQMEAEGRPVLVLHAGDFLFPSVMSKYQLGEPMVDMLNRLDGDADGDPHLFVTFGNHEFDSGDPGIVLGRIAQSDFTWLASALRYRSGGEGDPEPLSVRLPNVVPARVLDLNGIRVGLLGLTLDYETRPWIVYGYQPAERNAAVRAVIDSLRREGAELLIALTHQNLEQDCQLARDFPELQLVVGGHEHVGLLERSGDTWISKADADARTVVRIDVRRGPAGAIAVRHRTIPVPATVPPDPALVAASDAWRTTLGKTVKDRTGRDLAAVVATTENALEGVEPVIRGRETALGNFLADVLRNRFRADIGLLNGGAVRINDDIPAGGEITQYEMEGIFYYDNVPVAFRARGRELLGLLRVSAAEAHMGAGRFLQIAGLRYRYHPDRLAAGQPVVEAEDVEVLLQGASAYAPLELEREYQVATLDYLWKNGYRDGYSLFSAGNAAAGGTSPPRLDDPNRPLSWRGITEDAIRTLPGNRITTKIEGRIVRVGEAPPPPHCAAP